MGGSTDASERLRAWTPIPVEGRGIDPGRWLLLEGNRYAVTFALVPFLILTAYMLRLATVAVRTSAAGTLVLRP